MIAKDGTEVPRESLEVKVWTKDTSKSARRITRKSARAIRRANWRAHPELLRDPPCSANLAKKDAETRKMNTATWRTRFLARRRIVWPKRRAKMIKKVFPAVRWALRAFARKLAPCAALICSLLN
jgi:hypothetical protein